MINYLIRRICYAIPILLAVNLFTFALFFMVNSPDEMARMQLGDKYVDAEAITAWKAARGYDRPLLWNSDLQGVEQLKETLFFQHSLKLFLFEFGDSEDGRNIAEDLSSRMWPSFALALPTLVIGTFVNIVVALSMVMLRGTFYAYSMQLVCVGLLSISSVFLIIGGQYWISKVWQWVPISGYEPGGEAWRFLLLPILIGVVSGIGFGSRLYRTIFLEEANKDYMRTASAKGCSQWQAFHRHLLPNGLLPIITNVVAVIPQLFLGSLLMESFFSIPGLGSYTIDAIQGQDFAALRAVVFLGAVLYIIGLLCTDVAYSLADPRVRL